MAGEFRKLQTQTFAKTTVFESAEDKYWKKFRPAQQAGAETSSLSFFSPVTKVSFCEAQGYDFAVTSGTRVCIYDGKTAALKKTLARFKNEACGASFRHDGKLLAAGCKNKEVYVFDTAKGNLMRMLKGHEAAVQATGWASSGSFLLTCSDDQTARYWDVSSEEQLMVFSGHKDQVRSCSKFSQESVLGENVWATGSFDHTVKLWDARVNAKKGPIMDLKHEGPIETILAQPGPNPILLAAASNVVKVFDLTSGGRCVRELRDHQKTITTLFMDGTDSRILSGSLDGILKVTDALSYDCISSITIGSGQGILSAGIAKNNSMLAVGCVSGEVVLRKRSSKKDISGEDEEEGLDADFAPRGGTKRYFMRGGNIGPSPGDYKVVVKKRARLAPYDIHLKKFNYKQALDEVLKTKQPQVVTSLFEELQQRDGLRAALVGRDDASLEPILSFLVKFVTNPRFSSTLVNVCDVVLDLYTSELGQSVLVDELFSKLRIQLREEVRHQKDLMQLSGTLDMILSS